MKTKNETKNKTTNYTDTQPAVAAPVSHEIATAVAEVIEPTPANGASDAPLATTISSPVIEPSSNPGNVKESLAMPISNPAIEMVPPKKLKAHPTNVAIYGDESINEAFIESVRANGIFAPIVVTVEYVVVSGHRRLKAALKLKLATVPIVVVPEKDPIAIEKLLLDANQQREKTEEQKGREFMKRKEIEAIFAARRMKHKEEGDSGGSVDDKKGKAADIAAKEVGWSGVTGEKAAKVIVGIDLLKKAGRNKEAGELREALNRGKGSVTSALKMAKQLGAIESKAPKAKQANSKVSKASNEPFKAALTAAKVVVKFLESDAAKEMSKDETDKLSNEITRADGLLSKI